MIKITSELENLKSESGIKFSHKDVLFECNPGMTPDRKLNMSEKDFNNIFDERKDSQQSSEFQPLQQL